VAPLSLSLGHTTLMWCPVGDGVTALGGRRAAGEGGLAGRGGRWCRIRPPALRLGGGEPPPGSEGLGGRARGPLPRCPAAAILAAASRAEAAGLAGAVDEVVVVLLFSGEGERERVVAEGPIRRTREEGVNGS
jgi:hypothetical protein